MVAAKKTFTQPLPQRHTHVNKQIHHLYFLPNVLIFSRGCSKLTKIFIFADFFFFFLEKTQKKSHLSFSLAHAKIINAFQRGTCGATCVEGRQKDADIAPGLWLEIISEEKSLGMFYSYQDSSYLTCILVFTQTLP